jgi:glutathione peroxidase
VPDADGAAGDVQWNFEKWLLSPDGEPVARFRPRTEPDDSTVLAALDRVSAGG